MVVSVCFVFVCLLVVVFVVAFTRLRHDCQDLLSPCDGMIVCTDQTSVYNLIHPRKRNVTTSMVGLKKDYLRNNPTQNGESQRSSWGTHKNEEYSHPKEFLGIESELINSKEENLLNRAAQPRVEPGDTASRRTASPTHSQLYNPGPRVSLINPLVWRYTSVKREK